MADKEKKDIETGVVDKAALLADEEFETDTYPIPGMGDIEYRGLSRAELMRVAKIGNSSGVQEAEAFMVSKSMVSPKMTVEEVKKWQAKPRGKYIEGLVEEINEISGVNESAGKAATIRFPD